MIAGLSTYVGFHHLLFGHRRIEGSRSRLEIIHTTLGIQHWTCLKPSHIISSIWRQGFYGVSNAVCSSIGHIIDQCVDSVVLGSVENLLASSFFLLTLTPLSQVVLFPNSSYVFSGLLIAYVVLLFASLGDPN